MDGSSAPTINLISGLGEIGREDWDALANPPGESFDPFVSYDFLRALEQSGCVGVDTGWTPAHLIARDARGAALGAMPLYAKDHSYGEYVFDHAWADALMRSGGRYYPKLQCAAPFTPVPGRRILACDVATETALARGAAALCGRAGASSVHITFTTERLCDHLVAEGFLKRVGVQYHWFNRGYRDFEDFLAALSSQKRKMLRRERVRAQEGLRIRRLRGAEITPRDWDFFFRCYMDTGARKWGSPYLNRDFFDRVAASMGERLVLFIADEDGAPIASALNFLGGEALYGRYWGRVAERPFLHFELCYYQAIDLAIELGLPRVEAGAQGEHKLARGYVPVETFSAHWIAHPGLRDAVARYLKAETPAVADEVEALAAHAPYKKAE